MLAAFEKRYDDNRFKYKFQIEGNTPFSVNFDPKKDKILMCKYIGKRRLSKKEKKASEKCQEFECSCFKY